MREKLRSIGLRLTELANYLDVSRPTIYKYLDDFESRKYKQIDSQVLDTFRFINKKNTLTKLQVIDYIIKSKRDQEGLPSELTKKIERIVLEDNRLSELEDVIALFDLKDSEKVIQEIVYKYIKGDVKWFKDT